MKQKIANCNESHFLKRWVKQTLFHLTNALWIYNCLPSFLLVASSFPYYSILFSVATWELHIVLLFFSTSDISQSKNNCTIISSSDNDPTVSIHYCNQGVVLFCCHGQSSLNLSDRNTIQNSLNKPRWLNWFILFMFVENSLMNNWPVPTFSSFY